MTHDKAQLIWKRYSNFCITMSYQIVTRKPKAFVNPWLQWT